MPIISNKRRNIFLDFQDQKIKDYLLNEKLEPYDFLKRYYKESTYIELEAGTPKQKVIAMLNSDLTTTKCEINPLFQKKNNTNFFSNTYSFILEKEIEYRFGRLIGDGYDKFYFPLSDYIPDYLTGDKIKENGVIFLPFHILIDYHLNSSVRLSQINATFDFQLGMDFTTIETVDNFIKILKKNNLTPTYDFTIELYKNPIINYTVDTIETGRVIFGKFDEIYKASKDSLKSTNCYQDYGRLKYVIGQTVIYSQLKNEKIPISFNELLYISFHDNLFEGSHEYHNHIKKEFFDKHNVICELHKFAYSYDDVYFYRCTDLVDLYKHEFPNLEIYQKDFNYTFEFTFDDLFMKYDKHYYFLIVFGVSGNKWTIGNIFLRKYKLYYNYDSKKIMFFNGTIIPEKNNKFLKALKIIGIIMLVLFLMFISYYIGKVINKKRKLRAQELDDNYEYTNMTDKI